MTDKPFTDEEIEILRKLIPYAQQMEEEAQFSAAKTLVWSKYRKAIIALSVLIGASALIYDYTGIVLKKLLGVN